MILISHTANWRADITPYTNNTFNYSWSFEAEKANVAMGTIRPHAKAKTRKPKSENEYNIAWKCLTTYYQKVNNFLSEQRLNLFKHPPYSQDISPCDFWLFFGRIKRELGHQGNEILNNIEPKEYLPIIILKSRGKIKTMHTKQGRIFVTFIVLIK